MTLRELAIAIGFTLDSKSEKKAKDGVDKLKSYAVKTLGAIGIGFSLVGAVKIIDEFGKINAQIKNATGNLVDQNKIQQAILKSANNARMAYGDVAKTVSSLVQSSNDLFDPTTAVKFAEVTAKMLKSENKEQSEILNLQGLINKSFAKGAVDAGSLAQIIEKSPTAAKVLADSFGASRSEVVQLAQQGSISLAQLRDAFLNNAKTIDSAFENVDATISDSLQNIRNQWGLWLHQFDKSIGLTRFLSKTLLRFFNSFMSVLKRTQNHIEKFVKSVGGIDNLMKLLTFAVVAFFLAFKTDKIVSFFKFLHAGITGVKLKTLALAGALVLIFLAFEDLYNFLKGNDSVIGSILQSFGIDAEKVRVSILSAFDALKEHFKKIVQFLKTILGGLLEFIFGAFTGDWNRAFKGLENALTGLYDFAVYLLKIIFDTFKRLGEAIAKYAPSMFDGISKAMPSFISGVKKYSADFFKYGSQFLTNLADGISKSLPAITTTLATVVNSAVDFAADLLPQTVDLGIDLIENLLCGIINAVPSFIASLPSILKTIIVALFNILVALITKIIPKLIGAIFRLLVALGNALLKMLTATFKAIVGSFSKIFERLPSFIPKILKAVWSAVTSIATTALNVLKGAFSLYVKAIQGALNIIATVFKAVWNGLVAFFKAVWNGFVTVINTFKNIYSAVLSVIATAFKAVWDALVAYFKGIWDGFVTVVNTFVSVYNAIMSTLSTIFSTTWSGILNFFKTIWDSITSIFSGVTNFFSSAFGGAVKAIQNAFSPLTGFFSNIWNAVAGTVKAPINAIIKGINLFLGGLNKIKIPDWVPGVGGKGINIPLIPTLAKGGVLKRGQVGLLEGHGAEAVVPLEKNREWIGKVTDGFKTAFGFGSETDSKGSDSLLKGVKNVLQNGINYLANLINVKTQGETSNQSSIWMPFKEFAQNLKLLTENNSPSKVISQMQSSNTNKTITQNISFTNTYNGDRAGQAKSTEAMKKGADTATDQLARALAYS